MIPEHAQAGRRGTEMSRNIDESESTEIRDDAHAPQPESAKLNLAYDLVFALVEDVYAKYGRTSHELVGIAFEGDKLSKVHVLFVSEDNVPNVPDAAVTEQIVAGVLAPNLTKCSQEISPHYALNLGA